MNRLWCAGLFGLLMIQLSPAKAAAALPQPLISLDVQAQNPSDGDLVTWINAGVLKAPNGSAGRFNAVGIPPIVQTVAGRRAVTFNGMNGYRSNFTMPEKFHNYGPWTVSYWVYNPSVQTNDFVFGWTILTGGLRAAFIFGNSPNYGAAVHGSQVDMGFDRGVPSSSAWHNITITFEGATGIERVYVDGILNALEDKPDAITSPQHLGDPVWIAATDMTSAAFNFTGSLASLKVYDTATSWSGVMEIAGLTPPAPEDPPVVVNGSFELDGGVWAVGPYTTSASNGGNRIIPGWATSETWIPDSPARTNIGVYARNRMLTLGGGPWDNGAPADGNRVLAIAGKTSATQAVSQWVNLKGGRHYRILIDHNARTTGSASMTVRLDGARIGQAGPVAPVNAAGDFTAPFRLWQADVTPATDGPHELEIEQSTSGTQHVLLIDRVRIVDLATSGSQQGAKPAGIAAVASKPGPGVRNGGFEYPINTYSEMADDRAWYRRLGDNQAIPYWTPATDGIGVGEVNHPAFIYNNPPPEGRQALWIQTMPGYYPLTRGVSQTLGSLTAGKTYKLALQANSKHPSSSGSRVGLTVKVGGTALLPLCVSTGTPIPTSTTTAITGAPASTWHRLLYTFEAQSTTASLELLASTIDPGSFLALDNVKLYEVGSPQDCAVPALAGGGLKFTGTTGIETAPQIVTLYNEGGSTLTVHSYSIIGENARHFLLKRNLLSASDQISPFGRSLGVAVAMKARSTGAIGSAALQFFADDAIGTHTVPLSGISYDYPAIANGSFEQPVAYWENDGTWRCIGQNIPGGIPGWSVTHWANGIYNSAPFDRYGISINMNPATTDAAPNNGKIAYGMQAAWLQTAESGNSNATLKEQKALRQTVHGFYAGRVYHVRCLVNAKNQGDQIATWALHYWPGTTAPSLPMPDANTLINENDLAAVDNLGVFTIPYKEFTGSFTATASGQYTFQFFMPYQYDDSTLLIDYFEIPGRHGAAKDWAGYE